MRRLLLLGLVSLFSLNFLLAQKEANNWFFVGMNALTFNYGPPQNISCPNPLGDRGTAVASDTAGNLLFYTNGVKVWTKTHQQMQNGYGLSGKAYYQTCVAFRKPGSFRYYYIFTIGNYSFPPNDGLRYSLVDMDANGGEGAVVQKNIALGGGGDAMDVVTATLHKNNRDVWVITRVQLFEKYIYACFLVTPTGIELPVYTDNYKQHPGMTFSIGGIKVSPNGKKFIDFQGADDFLGNFDNVTGTLTKICNSRVTIPSFITIGGEFSNDSKYFYYCGTQGNTEYTVYQFDATAPDSLSYVNSSVLVGSVHQTVGTSNGQFLWMQAAPDGKIYGVRQGLYYLFTLNYPDEYGIDCGFQLDGYQLNNKAARSLPQFVSSYTQHIYYTGSCAGTAFQFTANFQPTPVSITWDFGDGGTSNQMNPTHIYTNPGTYEVVAYVVYPDGKTGEAHREVLVYGVPYPNLGPDLTVCQGTSVTLSPGNFPFCIWSTGSHFATINVSDTGSYWVQVVNDTGCINRDTININWYPHPQIDESNLNVAPTTCNASTGAITGLAVNGLNPMNFTWKNGSGSVIGSGLDLYHLPVDNYSLWVTDSAGCTFQLKSYTIKNVGDSLILSVDHQDTHCNINDGMIHVNATAGLSNMLMYSLDNSNYVSNQGLFTSLPAGSYQVWVKDSLGCKKVYDGNPVIIVRQAGPQALVPVIQDETNTQGNGSIQLAALSSSDTLWYSIGGAPQLNNGLFTNLSAKTYTCIITDKFGCDTTFTVILKNLVLIKLQAIAGDGSVCLGNVAVLPLQANSFSHVSAFDSRLKYNKAQVTCQNYLNANPALADSLHVDLFPALGEISLTWTGKNPVNLADGSTLVELSFASLLTGQDSLKWDISPGICTFLDSLGNVIAPEFKQGQVRVYSIPQGTIQAPETVCEGSDLSLIGNYTPGSGNGPISYQWSGPDGFTDTNPVTFITGATLANAGEYLLNLADTNHCQGQASFQLNVIPTPVADFSKDTVYFDQQTEIQARPGYAWYAWSTGDSSSSITITAEGWYKVMIRTAEGCTTVDSLMALFSFAPFNMPNAFSPNADGYNDNFRPVTQAEKIKSFTMYIYDRWGRQVFATKDLGNGWNGNIDGKPAPVGVYTYIISFSYISGETRKKSGTITLIR